MIVVFQEFSPEMSGGNYEDNLASKHSQVSGINSRYTVIILFHPSRYPYLEGYFVILLPLVRYYQTVAGELLERLLPAG